LITNGILVAIVFSKVSRPSRLRHTINFSNVALINNDSHFNYPINDEEEQFNSLVFRIFNLRKRQLVDPNLYLFLLKKEIRDDGAKQFIIYELPFEIHKQIGRTRDINISRPVLPLPWTIMHRIDKSSPLYGLTKMDLIESEAEIIAVVEGVDELTSNYFQRRWSYLPKEILWDHNFIDIVCRDSSGKLKINYHKFSDVVPMKN